MKTLTPIIFAFLLSLNACSQSPTERIETNSVQNEQKVPPSDSAKMEITEHNGINTIGWETTEPYCEKDRFDYRYEGYLYKYEIYKPKIIGDNIIKIVYTYNAKDILIHYRIWNEKLQIWEVWSSYDRALGYYEWNPLEQKWLYFDFKR